MHNETATESTSSDTHAAAAEAFVDQMRSQHGDEIAELYISGKLR
ncbi:hypothetical protein SAMN04487948_11955 [Halogranum amylolyticum]|uniref:Uncharacterized protein n=1 Tax=Halogranum amylolyticum TaxID=660520 RepID=A0A1H8VT52_9EURY|nr:hypothetical protein [Halogranum amylolyticum]SEP18609.1 hypothetical protein SAMN04487948_11955 [Halogranum amylolyticum]